MATHLHYGGSLNPRTNALGPKPSLGVTFRKQKRFETIIRLENAGLGEQAIAAMLCISVNRLRYLKKDPDYLSARIRITHGIITDHEASLSQIKEQRKEILTQSLPAALQVLANELLAPAITLAERKHKVEVARDLLDREGTFAKVSRTEVKPVESFSFEEADKASSSVIHAIRNVASAAQPRAESSSSIEDMIATAASFASGETIDASAQQAALEKLEAEAAETAPELLEFLPPASKEIQ